jgi:DNA primase
MDMDEQILLSELNKIRNKRFNEKSNTQAQAPENTNYEAAIALEQKKEEAIVSTDHQERKIIELLINYGDKIIMVDSEDDEGRPIQVESNIAHLIVAELTHDNIVMDNAIYKSVYNEFVTHLDNNTIPDSKYFLNHEDNAISLLTIDLISSPYALANWERHSIYTNMEEDDLKKSALKAVYTLKSRRLEIMVHDVEKKMKASTTDDEIIQLQQVKHQLDVAKVSINAFLGRIIVK